MKEKEGKEKKRVTVLEKKHREKKYQHHILGTGNKPEYKLLPPGRKEMLEHFQL